MPFLSGGRYRIGNMAEYQIFRALNTAQLATITALEIADGLTLNELTINNLPLLTSLTFGAGVNILGAFALSGCGRLNNFVMPENVLIESFLLGEGVPWMHNYFGNPEWFGRHFNSWTMNGRRQGNPHRFNIGRGGFGGLGSRFGTMPFFHDGGLPGRPWGNTGPHPHATPGFNSPRIGSFGHFNGHQGGFGGGRGNGHEGGR